jgi:carbonic anhydrase/acetyltransferase-like protein (isoleucine patch superfamily)
MKGQSWEPERGTTVGDSGSEGPAFIHESAAIFGEVTIGTGSSIWPNVVVRAECQSVRIGCYSNIQDFSMLHIGFGNPVIVGDYCSITHHVTLHGCIVEDYCLIGINSTIMDGCVIGRGSIVAGHSFLREGTIVPPGSIVMGTPGKVVREQDAGRANILNALAYHRNALAYALGDFRAWAGLDMAALKSEAEAIHTDKYGDGSV